MLNLNRHRIKWFRLKIHFHLYRTSDRDTERLIRQSLVYIRKSKEVLIKIQSRLK